VILFVGDGMSIATVTASRILKGQLKNRSGEESTLAFEEFPHLSLLKVWSNYCLKKFSNYYALVGFARIVAELANIYDNLWLSIRLNII